MKKASEIKKPVKGKTGKNSITKEGHGEGNPRVNHTKHAGKIGFFGYLEEFFHT